MIAPWPEEMRPTSKPEITMKLSIRQLVWSAGALFFIQGGSIYAQSPTPLKTLVGTWKATISPDGFPSFTAFNQFNADGTSIEFDNSNPPGSQTVAVGPWERRGNNDYAMLEVNQIFDNTGFAGEVRVQAKITIDGSGDAFTSTFTFQVLDPTGAVVFEGTGTAKGIRITIDSLSRLVAENPICPKKAAEATPGI